MQRGSVARSAIRLSKMVQPGQYVCFCGCTDGKHFGRSLM